MKYILIIWICSFSRIMHVWPLFEYPTMYDDSWYECAHVAAHTESSESLN